MDLCVVRDANHAMRIPCGFGNFYASGMQGAEVTKSLVASAQLEATKPGPSCSKDDSFKSRFRYHDDSYATFIVLRLQK